MLSERGRARLEDIRENIRLAQAFIGEMSRADFEAKIEAIYAVTRCLEIISEASKFIDAEVRDRHPALPWRRIADAGNVYRHVYKEVRDEVIWNTVRTALPPLLAAVEAELGS